jgi:putative FmdB family regulatory protein
MPVFDYRCEECKTTYDVYHKVREIAEDVVCPSCGSKSYKRLISLPGVSVASSGGCEQSSKQTCESGRCSGGMCGVN